MEIIVLLCYWAMLLRNMKKMLDRMMEWKYAYKRVTAKKLRMKDVVYTVYIEK